MEQLNLVQKIVTWALPVIFAITVHEVAHGFIAFKLGDPTAKMLGRLTLNPLKHIDLMGTLIVPGLLLLVGGFIFGWAKPVPITWSNLKKPDRDMALVALAGPAANLCMAIIWAILLKLSLFLDQNHAISMLSIPLTYMGQAGILINSILMILNLLPIPPLDGAHVIQPFLSKKLQYLMYKIEPYGFFILLALILLGILGKIMNPLLQLSYSAITGIVGL